MSKRDRDGRAPRPAEERVPAWRRPRKPAEKDSGNAAPVGLEEFETKAKEGSNRAGHDRSQVLGTDAGIEPSDGKSSPATHGAAPPAAEETDEAERDRTSLRIHQGGLGRGGARLGSARGDLPQRRPSRGPAAAAVLMVLVAVIGVVWASNLMLAPSGKGFLFQAPAAVNGTITLRGAPLEGAMVSIESTGVRAFTDRDGAYRFPAVALGRQDLIITHPLARTAVVSIFVVSAATQPPADADLQAAPRGPIDLRTGSAALLLQAVDDTGTPLPGTVVRALLPEGNRTVLSDAHGGALLENLSAGRLQLHVEHPDHAPLTLWLTLLGGTNPVQVGLVRGTVPQVRDLDGEGSALQLHVRDHLGAAQVGALVLVDSDRSHPATTDGAGHVRLPALTPGDHRIVVRAGTADAQQIDLTVRGQLPAVEVALSAPSPTKTSKVGEAYNVLAACGSVYLLISALMLVAAYAAYRRTRLWMVVTICVLDLLANLVTIGYAAIPAFIAIALVVINWREFE